jgi:hypothetical protein
MTSTTSDDQAGDWVTVYDAMSVQEASIVRGRLEVEDIPVFLRVDSPAILGMAPIGQGVQVQVPRALVERAEEVLGEGRRPGRV